MKKNKILSIIAVGMLPIVVISFVFKKGEANFNLNENSENREDAESSNESQETENKDADNKERLIKVLVNGNVVTLTLEEYIVGVVAGEMPASFDKEALKAQAVASRTYALYKKNTNDNNEYDLTDNTNTQVYLTNEAMQKKWGEDYSKYYNKIKEAVEETHGEVITYDGEIIEAFYFAMSAGSTEACTSVFNENRDYLQSVISQYDNDSLRDYEKEQLFTENDFKEKLGLTCENIKVDRIDYTEAGYVNEVSICSKIFKGTEFRKLLGLRSANFSIDVDDSIKVVTKGYGHGVGMSQYGANGYANHGYTYEDILKHYYTGVQITKLDI